MATKTNPAELLKQAVSVGDWRFISDGELSDAVAALAKVIGKREANLPSWQRRMAVTADGSRFLVVLNGCLQRDPSCINFDDCMPEALRAIPVALPIPEAVALLASDAGPERELERRRALAKKREAEQAEKARIAAEKFHAENAARQKAAEERLTYKADAFAKLSPLARFGAFLAMAVEKRDPALAADIRSAADVADQAEAFPRSAWWSGMDRTMEAQRVAAVLLTIPRDTRTMLETLHNRNPAKVVAAWEATIAAQRTRAA